MKRLTLLLGLPVLSIFSPGSPDLPEKDIAIIPRLGGAERSFPTDELRAIIDN